MPSPSLLQGLAGPTTAIRKFAMQRLCLSVVAGAAVLTALGLTTGAHAAWTFTTNNGTVANADGGSGAASTYTANGNAGESTATLSIAGAYAVNGASNLGFASGATWSQVATPSSTQASTGAALLSYGSYGIGMASDGNSVPNHALDNNGTTEAVILKFGSSVTLNQIGLGYTSNGSTVDLSVWRFVGSTAPTAATSALSGTGTSLAQMNTAGWELVGNYGDVGVDTTSAYYALNNTTKGSSWWLVSAYNSAWNVAANGTTGGNAGSAVASVSTLDVGNDYFKLYAVAGTACTATTAGNNCYNPSPPSSGNAVPEPGSLALVGAAGLGAWWARRRALRAIKARVA